MRISRQSEEYTELYAFIDINREDNTLYLGGFYWLSAYLFIYYFDIVQLLCFAIFRFIL